MTNERLKRVTSKIEAAVERLAQLDPAAQDGAGASPAKAPPAEEQERQRREIEDRDRKIAKLRADLDDISDLKDQEIARLRDALQRQAQPVEPPGESIEVEEHAALQRRYDRLREAAQATQQRLEALIARMEDGDG